MEVKMIYGTSYFYDKDSAFGYYAPYCPGATKAEIKRWVEDKIKYGEIHVREKPPIEPGDQLFLDEKEGRYFVETKIQGNEK